MKRKPLMALLAAASLLLAGCESFGTMGRTQRHTSSLVQYLYPNRTTEVDKPTIPTLTLPLRVGVAFVPEDTSRQNSAYYDSAPLSEQQKMKLLEAVSDQFRKYPFVKSIEVMPSAYLASRGGFENVDQLRSMFDVDVIALVSYDQMQFTSETKWSFAYLTIVGAYFIEGEKKDTRTMLDAAVYDIASRKLLFRAPGLNQINGRSTPVDVARESAQDREKGFVEASTNLVTNLEAQLALFREKVKESPQDVKIVRSAGYTGAGAVGFAEALAVAALALAGFCARRKQ